jgi:hypothetical protein
MASPKNATARRGSGPNAEEATPDEHSQDIARVGQRDSYADVGVAMRDACARARDARLNGREYRVFTAVLELTASYSRLGDHVYTAAVAARADVDPKATRVMLGKLGKAGVIDYRPARGQGRKSWVGLSVEKGVGSHPLSTVTERGSDRTPFYDEKGVGSDTGKGVGSHPPTEKQHEKKAAAADLVSAELQELFERIALSPRQSAHRQTISTVYATHPDWVRTKALELASRTRNPVDNIGAVLAAAIADEEHLRPATLNLTNEDQLRRSTESWYENVGRDLPTDAFEEELAAQVKRGLPLNDAEGFRERHAQDAAELADAA